MKLTLCSESNIYGHCKQGQFANLGRIGECDWISLGGN